MDFPGPSVLASVSPERLGSSQGLGLGHLVCTGLSDRSFFQLNPFCLLNDVASLSLPSYSCLRCAAVTARIMAEEGDAIEPVSLCEP